MPTYQYECAACRHAFEKFQSMMDSKLKKCPKCGKNKLHRLIGAGSGIIFKGTGFYETDYKKKSPAAGAASAGAGPAAVKDEKPKTEKKTAAEGKTETSETGKPG